MSRNNSEGAGSWPEQTPGGMPDEATMNALGHMIVAGAEWLTRQTAHGRPGDQPSAMQGIAAHPTLHKIIEMAERIKKGELPDEGRI